MIDGMNPSAYPYVSRAYTGYYPERLDKSAPETIKDLTGQILGNGRVRLSGTQQSHAIYGLSRANCLVRLEPGQVVASGDPVDCSWI